MKKIKLVYEKDDESLPFIELSFKTCIHTSTYIHFFSFIYFSSFSKFKNYFWQLRGISFFRFSCLMLQVFLYCVGSRICLSYPLIAAMDGNNKCKKGFFVFFKCFTPSLRGLRYFFFCLVNREREGDRECVSR